jgi:hypothetical protein
LPSDTAQLHHDLDGRSDQAPCAGEQQESEGKLDQQRRDDTRREVARAVTQRHVEPRVTHEQRPGDDHEEGDDLALMPCCPARRGEPGQLSDVQPDPYGLPVGRGIVPGQGQDEDRDPPGQGDTAPGQEQQAEPQAAPQPGIGQRMRPVKDG